MGYPDEISNVVGQPELSLFLQNFVLIPDKISCRKWTILVAKVGQLYTEVRM